MYWSCYRGEETESREYYALFTLSQKAEKRKEKQKEEEGFCFYDRLLFFFLLLSSFNRSHGVTPLCRDKKKVPWLFFFFFLQLPPLPTYHCNHQKIYKQKQKERVGRIKKNTVKKRLKFKYEKNIIMMF